MVLQLKAIELGTNEDDVLEKELALEGLIRNRMSADSLITRAAA